MRSPLAALGARTPAFGPHRLMGCQAAQTVPCGRNEVLIRELIILLLKYGSVHTGCKALRLLGSRLALPCSRALGGPLLYFKENFGVSMR